MLEVETSLHYWDNSPQVVLSCGSTFSPDASVVLLLLLPRISCLFPLASMAFSFHLCMSKAVT